MKKQNIYKGIINNQSEFDHKYSCWANNHRGWAKMKRKNRKRARRILREQEEYLLEIGSMKKRNKI